MGGRMLATWTTCCSHSAHQQETGIRSREHPRHWEVSASTPNTGPKAADMSSPMDLTLNGEHSSSELCFHDSSASSRKYHHHYPRCCPQHHPHNSSHCKAPLRACPILLSYRLPVHAYHMSQLCSGTPVQCCSHITKYWKYSTPVLCDMVKEISHTDECRCFFDLCWLNHWSAIGIWLLDI